MIDKISLNVWCPLCNKSLMDHETEIDNEPSIKLGISKNNDRGTINLSSLYGSYHYKSDLDILFQTEYKFNCPSCNQDIISSIKCDECSATMIPLNIEGAGIVRFCSRSGCKNHSIEIEDIEAIDYFSTKKEIIKSGSYLQAFCPHCKKTNTLGNTVKFKVKNQKDEIGELFLSPYLNFYTDNSTVNIAEGELVKEVMCPNCSNSLFVEDKKCTICSSPIIGINVAAKTKLINFYFCSKKGCPWHGLSEKDVKFVFLESNDK
jgi:predicted RNA-binding Zn-ribbon protein involved in translation (DUF1610 family)